MADTKECIGCEAVIGDSETKCPKCGVDLAEMEETVSAVEKAQAILDKRRKKKEAETTPAPAPETATQPRGAARLRSLGRAFQKKG